MSVKILCAGCSKDEREQAEADVRKALADRAASDEWMVSLVKLADRWSVTLDAPAARLRALTVMAPQGRLADSIREALNAGLPARTAPPAGVPVAAPPVAASPPAAPAATTRTPTPAPAANAPPAPPRAGDPVPAPSGGRLSCAKCGGAFVVVYERAGESLEAAPVACPHCWHVNRVMIDAEAAFNRDYRAEKA
jgi:hypothetical protein